MGVKRSVYQLATRRMQRRARHQAVVVGVCYHRFEVMAHDDPLPGMAITPERFVRHVQWMREVGDIIPLSDASQRDLAPGLHFFVSFDDGYADNVRTLLPIVKARRLPVTLFVTSDFVRGTLPRLPHDTPTGFAPAAMSPSQLREAADTSGVTIGCHTATHRRMENFEADVWQQEWSGSRRWLESVVEQPVEHAAYPFGGPADFSWEEGGRFLLEAGFRSLCSNFGGVNHPENPVRLRDSGRHLVHLRRAPAPNVDDRDLFLGWVLGMAGRGSGRPDKAWGGRA